MRSMSHAGHSVADDSLAEARGRQEGDRMCRRPRDRQVRQYLADDTGELEAVSGASTREDHTCIFRVAIDDEVLIRCVRIEACDCRPHLARRTRHVPVEHCAMHGDFRVNGRDRACRSGRTEAGRQVHVWDWAGDHDARPAQDNGLYGTTKALKGFYAQADWVPHYESAWLDR